MVRVLVDNIKLYRHQEIFLSLMQTGEPVAGFLEAGVGKTLPTLYFIAELLRDGKIEDALIVGPAATLGVWERDIEKFRPDAQERLRGALTVVSYDLVWRRPEFNRAWGVIVLDESHYIKNRAAKRSKFLLKIAPMAQYRVILTGTPIGNKRLEDIWSQFTFLYPGHTPKQRPISEIFGTWTAFINRYCILNKYFQPYRYLNVAELQSIVADYSYQVTKAECLDLPDILPDDIWEIELAEKKIYNDLQKHSVIEEIELIAANALSKMLYLRQLTSGFVGQKGREPKVYKTNKLKMLEEFLDGHDRKLVIFCEFKRSIDEVCKVLNKRGVKHIVLDGRARDKTVWRRFQADESIQVIVCQSQAAGAGIDLYAADTELFYELPLSSTVHEQCRARIHRVGQTQKCSYVYFLTKGTVERAIYRTLKDYKDFSEKVFEEYLDDYQKGFNQ